MVTKKVTKFPAKVKNHGAGSKVVIIPYNVLEYLGIELGDTVIVDIQKEVNDD